MLILPQSNKIDYREGYTACVKHIHLFEEFIFVKSGGCTILTDHFTRRLSDNFVIYMPRRTPHEQINDPDAPYRRWLLIFDKTTQLYGACLPDKPFVGELTEEQIKHFFDMLSQLRLLYAECERIADIECARYAHTRRDLMISMIINDLCELMNENELADNVKSEDCVSAVCDYIDANFNRRLNLDELAARFFISRTKLTRTFRKKTGMSVGEYITAIRISRSKQLLLESRRLEEIARLCGFQCANYYIKVFERVCGMSPTCFRNNYMPDL